MSMALRSLLLAVMLSKVGCTSVHEDAGAAGSLAEDESLGVAVEALGGLAIVWGGILQGPRHLGETYALAQSGGTASRISDAETGTTLADGLPLTDRAAASDGSAVAAASPAACGGAIYIMQMTPAAGGWTQLADIPEGECVRTIFLSATHVYWAGSSHTFRVPRSGGAVATFAENRAIVAIDVKYAFLQEDKGNGTFTLSRKGIEGDISEDEDVLRDQLTDLAGDDFDSERLAQDGTHFYWVETSGSTRYIRRMTKDGASISNAKSSTTVDYGLPRPYGNMLYYLQKPAGALTWTTLVRKNQSNGNHVSAAFNPAGPIGQMLIKPSGVWLLGNSLGTGLVAWRGSL